jgi:hypothetical protein
MANPKTFMLIRDQEFDEDDQEEAQVDLPAEGQVQWILNCFIF